MVNGAGFGCSKLRQLVYSVIVQMSYQVDEEVQLDQSKFLSEQVNWDQEPTQEEIVEKAEELGIDDYGMAREALLKELDPEWRPYINRKGQVFYINLEEKKGFVDHPIDMFYQIHYAIKTKRKIPTFQDYSLDEVSEDPRILLREIANFKKEQGLRVVYEESEEESVRKNTKRSVEEEELVDPAPEFSLEYEKEVRAYREEMERQLASQLSNYRSSQERYFRDIEERHEKTLERVKQQRLAKLGQQFSEQWQVRNRASFQKARETTRADLQEKKERFEDLLHREYDLKANLYSANDLGMNYRLLYKSKAVARKRKERDALLVEAGSHFSSRVNEELCRARTDYEEEVKKVTDSKLHYRDIWDRNLREINASQVIPAPRKRKFSIFCDRPANQQSNIQTKLDEFSCREEVWSADLLSQGYTTTAKPSLSLRLFKRLL